MNDLWGNLAIYGMQAALFEEEQNLTLEILKCAKWGFLQHSCDLRNVLQLPSKMWYKCYN
jgi:hypothetical protein